LFVQEEKETLTDLDNRMWNPELQIPVEFRNLEPLWRKLNKVEFRNLEPLWRKLNKVQ
jgi:hypothetical protein